MAQICIGLSSFLLGVEHLCVSVTRTKSRKYDSNREEWLTLTSPFIGTKWAHVAGEHSADIVLALLRSRMQGKLALPALRKLCIRAPDPRYEPSQDAVASLIYTHRAWGNIIAVECERLWIHERRGTGTAFVQCPFL
jgi:hypothetical protein